MDLRPVQRQSVSDDVFEQLTAQILEGGVEPGSALPAERALAETLGVNRQAVREALRRLAEAGLVEIVHGDATRVRDPHHSAGLALLPRLLVRSDGSVDAAVARSILEMRACLGPDAARLCAQRASTEQALELARSVDRMRELADDLVALQNEATRLWDHVVDGADNIAYRLAYNSLRETYEPIAPLLTDVLADELGDVDGHAEIAVAVAAHEPDRAAEAAEAVLSHGTTAVNRLLGSLPATAVVDEQ